MRSHDPHQTAPISRRIGRLDSLARLKASAPHGYQSTGWEIARLRYGLRSLFVPVKQPRARRVRPGAGAPGAPLCHYFGFCETPEVQVSLTHWIRLRLRAALWRQWKTPRRRAALIALGVRPRLASSTAASGHGPWYLARARALSVGLSNAYFKSRGLPTLIDGC